MGVAQPLFSFPFQAPRRYLSAVRNFKLSLILPLGVLVAAGFVQRAAPPMAATPKVFATANTFLATLSDAERTKVTFDFNSPQKSTGWSNLPSGIFQRNGLRMGDLTPPQRRSRARGGGCRAEPLGLPEGHRHHERRRGPEKRRRRTHRRTPGSAGRRRWRRRPRRRPWRRGSVRPRRVLHCLCRSALADATRGCCSLADTISPST